MWNWSGKRSLSRKYAAKLFSVWLLLMIWKRFSEHNNLSRGFWIPAHDSFPGLLFARLCFLNRIFFLATSVIKALLGRPYVSNGRSYVLLLMFLFFCAGSPSSTDRPETLPYDRKLVPFSSVRVSTTVYVRPILMATSYHERASSRHRPC